MEGRLYTEFLLRYLQLLNLPPQMEADCLLKIVAVENVFQERAAAKVKEVTTRGRKK